MTVTDLQLQVTKSVAGSLETNIATLENFVTERLKEYSPELYEGDAQTAKKDRAELNKAKEQIGTSRKALIAELMKPYSDFEKRCKALESMIADASSKLDIIVKAKEQEEKDAKKNLIVGIWESKKCEVVSFEKIFNSKWLNKTAKLTDIENEIDTVIQKVYTDLKAIEKLTSNAEIVKTRYLENLDLTDALEWGKQFEENHVKVQNEENTREEREHEEKIIEQKKELEEQQKDLTDKGRMAGLVADALEVEIKPTIKEYVVSFKGTESQMLGVKNYFTMNDMECHIEELEF